MKLDPSLKLRRMAHLSDVLLAPLAVVLIASMAAHAQGTPLDTGFTNLQNLFTGTVAKVASLIAIVIGGYQFAHGEPGGKKALAGVIVFIGGYAFGRWITDADPAMFRILARSEQFRARYDAAKQEVAAVEVR